MFDCDKLNSPCKQSCFQNMSVLLIEQGQLYYDLLDHWFQYFYEEHW